MTTRHFFKGKQLKISTRNRSMLDDGQMEGKVVQKSMVM